MRIPNHLTCLLRNLYAGQEATARTGHGTTWTRSKLGKEYIKAVYSHPAYLLICKVHHAKCQIGLITSWNQDCQEKYQQPQISRWYHSNCRKWRETKKPLDEGERGKTKIMASGPITSWQIDGETVETVTDYFLGLKITVDSDCSH